MGAAPVVTGGKRVVTEVKEQDGDQGYLAELIVVDDKYIVAVGGTYNQPTVLVSSNGKDFVRRKGLGSGLRAVVAWGGGLLEVGEYGLVATSGDLGKTWTKHESGTQVCLFGVTVHGGRPWICGDEGYAGMFNGTACVPGDFALDEQRQSDVVSIGDKLYFLGYDGCVRVIGADGSKQAEARVSEDNPLCALARTPSGALVLCGDNGFLARSDGGLAFTKITVEHDDDEITDDLEAVAVLADGTVMVVGDNGTILLSTDDGRTWKKVEDTPDDWNHLWCILPFGSGALIGGDDGSVWKLALKGDKHWADRTDEFAGEEYVEDDDESDDDDDDDDDSDDDDDVDEDEDE